MGTRSVVYRDGKVVFFRAVMDEQLAVYVNEAVLHVRARAHLPSMLFALPSCPATRFPCRDT